MLSGAVVDTKVVHPPDAIWQKSAAMFPLPSKNPVVLSQPTPKLLDSPASLAQTTVI